MKLILVIFAAVMLYYASGEKARYDNYRVYTVTIENEEQLKIMEQIEEMNSGYSFWNDIGLNVDVDIMVPPHKFADFSDLVDAIKIQSKLKVENVQKLIDDEQSEAAGPRVNNWTSYGTYEQIYAWLNTMIAQYPNLLTNYNIGYSFQQRLTRAVRLSYKSGNPAVFIEANIHAREWVTSATATWFLNHLITSTDPVIRDIAENIDWYIIPIANVDGFVYSHTTDRMWRKTRQPHGTCYGADPNRNFGFQWMQGGASNNPCSDTFAGPLPWSEPETANIRDFLTGLGRSINIYFSFHSYGQYLLMPYGHTTAQSSNHANMMSIAAAAVTAISQRYGTAYTYGGIASTLYVASGGSSDWAFGTVGIPVSYTFEFRDRGASGFILPPAQIIPNALEVTDGIVAAIHRARQLGHI